jgi:hypothetical protein
VKNNGEKRDFLKISKIYLALQGNGKGQRLCEGSSCNSHSHEKKRKLQNLEAMQDWLSVSDNISNRRIEIATGKEET